MMDNVIVALLIAVLTERGITAAIIPLIVRRRNGKGNAEGLVKSAGGGMVCVYHKGIEEKLDGIAKGVEALNARKDGGR